MDLILPLLVTFLVSGMIASVSVFMASRKFRGSITQSVSDQLQGVVAHSKVLDEAINRSLARTDIMVPLTDMIQLQGEHQAILDKQAAEAQKLAGLEEKLQKAQSDVDTREASHNKIKMGKDDCDRIADDLRANQDSLLTEAKKLESDLENSKSQMIVLAGETGLTAEQQRMVNDLNQHVSLAAMQFKETQDVFEQARQRFLNLEAQYAQLETEFKSLVEQQISAGE